MMARYSYLTENEKVRSLIYTVKKEKIRNASHNTFNI